MNKLLLTLTASLVASFGALTAASAQDLNGLEIATRSSETYDGFGQYRVDMDMILIAPDGSETLRDLQLEALETTSEDEGDRSLTRFLAPADVAGTLFLSHSMVTESDKTWLFLPALGRPTEIRSRSKSGPFLGSEFAFEDLSSNEIGRYTYTYLETREVDGRMMDVVECVPTYEGTGYSKLHCFFDAQDFKPRRIEFFDRGGQHLKTLTLRDYRAYDNGQSMSHRQIMENHLTGKATRLVFGDFDFTAEINADRLQPEALETL